VADLGSDESVADELWQAIQRVVREVPDDIEIPETTTQKTKNTSLYIIYEKSG
jgi:hypothetical protein